MTDPQTPTDPQNTTPDDGLTPWQRLRHAFSLRRARSQLLAGLLCAVLGFTIVAQIRHTDESGLDTLSQSDLVRVLDDAGTRNDRLQSDAENLQRTRDRLESGSGNKKAALNRARKQADDLAILAGTAKAVGPGVTLTVTDPQSKVTSADVLNMIEELRDAGAEAIQIGHVRVVASTAIVNDGDAVSVGGARVASPYRLRVIGDADTIATALKIPGGVSDVVNTRGGKLTISKHKKVSVTAVVPEQNSK
ncbi:DUF881 domain-containing protein [Spelaeicoccus albus]|uniref:Uncharacterized protein YlxW (UPF0749 family) n=1 Tax=Spelaeicoccus albus TaxID=1280376 RepID=A0A7Z0D514_9MICO|nr:DUF881 domain-containing protein [Spelaeicoccus albus]NYI69017.1 uncharacterized protein YlxW (UPF0749 family) [Spelaeicoccus albus]